MRAQRCRRLPGKRFSTFASLILFLTIPTACSKNSPRPDAPAGAPNVLLILLDTLRTDKLGCYGSELGLTPKIDEFAKQGTLFENAFSHAPWTLPATASLLTSTYPSIHGAGGQYGKKLTNLSQDVRTIAECFGDQGYQTGAIVNVFFLSERFGMNRGFDTYDYRPPTKNQTDQRLADEVTDRSIAWLKSHSENSKRPFFYMAHYFDAHLTYDPPAGFRKQYALPSDYQPDPTLFGTEADMIRMRKGKIDITKLPMQRLERLYNGEVAFVDQEVGRLLNYLTEAGLDNNTIVVITTDHGEEFLDHGGFEHGHTMYDELIHVPLIVRFPGVISPKRIVQTIEHIDVAPTMCSLAGVKAEPTFTGRSLERLVFDESQKDHWVLSEGNMWGPSITAFRQSGYKLIVKPSEIEFYHVAQDPNELTNLVSKTAMSDGTEEKLSTAHERLKAVKKLAESKAPGNAEKVEFSETERKHLSSIGYVIVDE